MQRSNHRATDGLDHAIENAAPLPAEWLDHPLTGQWINHRECHIGGDFLLIYKFDGSGADERVVFVRTGTHAELFEKTASMDVVEGGRVRLEVEIVEDLFLGRYDPAKVAGLARRGLYVWWLAQAKKRPILPDIQKLRPLFKEAFWLLFYYVDLRLWI